MKEKNIDLLDETKQIKLFIKKLKKGHPDIKVKYLYDDISEIHQIELDKKTFKQTDIFETYIGKMIFDVLYSYDIYNFFVDYVDIEIIKIIKDISEFEDRVKNWDTQSTKAIYKKSK